MKAYEAVLFDLDGTLIDTAPDFAAVVNELRREESLSELPFNEIRSHVSHGSMQLVRACFNLADTDDKFDPMRQRLLTKYLANISRYSTLFEGMDTLLDTLEAHQIPWGIVTNKPSKYAIPLLEDLALDKRCQVLVCPDHVTHTKPHPEPMFKACQILSCEPRNTLYVGDHRRDIDAGKAANMETVAVRFGYLDPIDPIESWNADFIADHTNDLIHYIFKK